MDKKLYIDMLDNDEKKYIIEIFSEQSMESIENILVKSQELFCSERRQENKEKDKALVQYWLQQAYQWLEKVGNNDCFYPILMLSVSLLPKKLNKEDCLPSLKKVERFIIYAAEYVYINKVVPKEEIEKRNKWVIENKKDFSENNLFVIKKFVKYYGDCQQHKKNTIFFIGTITVSLLASFSFGFLLKSIIPMSNKYERSLASHPPRITIFDNNGYDIEDKTNVEQQENNPTRTMTSNINNLPTQTPKSSEIKKNKNKKKGIIHNVDNEDVRYQFNLKESEDNIQKIAIDKDVKVIILKKEQNQWIRVQLLNSIKNTEGTVVLQKKDKIFVENKFVEISKNVCENKSDDNDDDDNTIISTDDIIIYGSNKSELKLRNKRGNDKANIKITIPANKKIRVRIKAGGNRWTQVTVLEDSITDANGNIIEIQSKNNYYIKNNEYEQETVK